MRWPGRHTPCALQIKSNQTTRPHPKPNTARATPPAPPPPFGRPTPSGRPAPFGRPTPTIYCMRHLCYITFRPVNILATSANLGRSAPSPPPVAISPQHARLAAALRRGGRAAERCSTRRGGRERVGGWHRSAPVLPATSTFAAAPICEVHLVACIHLHHAVCMHACRPNGPHGPPLHGAAWHQAPARGWCRLRCSGPKRCLPFRPAGPGAGGQQQEQRRRRQRG